MTTTEKKREAKEIHLHLLVERLVREGRSDEEIARAVAQAATPRLRAA